jgi:hypothetical protein
MNVGNISTVQTYAQAYGRARKNFANTASIIREIVFIDAIKKELYFNCMSVTPLYVRGIVLPPSLPNISQLYRFLDN